MQSRSWYDVVVICSINTSFDEIASADNSLPILRIRDIYLNGDLEFWLHLAKGYMIRCFPRNKMHLFLRRSRDVGRDLPNIICSFQTSFQVLQKGIVSN